MRLHRDNTHHHVQQDAVYVNRLLHLLQAPLIGPHLQSSDKIQHLLLRYCSSRIHACQCLDTLAKPQYAP